MMKPLEAGQLAELQREFPVDDAPAKLTRKQKLERLAALIENYTNALALGHRIERYSDDGLASMPAFGALALATQDAVFLKDGLKGRSVKDVRDYLELSTPELHEFSCDCGGGISSEKMAGRIRGLADRGPPAPGIVSRIAKAITAGTF
jgi:hypothetical protein